MTSYNDLYHIQSGGKLHVASGKFQVLGTCLYLRLVACNLKLYFRRLSDNTFSYNLLPFKKP